MKVEIVYVNSTVNHAKRFWQTFEMHRPRDKFFLTVVENWAIHHMPCWADKVIPHDNSGWDIGGFQHAARTSTADMCVFLGSHVHFHRDGWLRRMIDTFKDDGLYGAMGLDAVIRTCAFWCNPKTLLKIYPEPVVERGHGGDRYEFEHGPDSVSHRFRRHGRPVCAVDWNRVYGDAESWVQFRIHERGHNQANLLVLDKHADEKSSQERCQAETRDVRQCELFAGHHSRHFADGTFF